MAQPTTTRSTIPGILQAVGSNGDVGILGQILVASLLLAFLTPAIILRTADHGFGGGMDVAAVWRQSTANVGQTVIAALLIWVAQLIGGVGLVLCIVGVLFTTVYANAVIAGIVYWYERTQGAASLERTPEPSL